MAHKDAAIDVGAVLSGRSANSPKPEILNAPVELWLRTPVPVT